MAVKIKLEMNFSIIHSRETNIVVEKDKDAVVHASYNHFSFSFQLTTSSSALDLHISRVGSKRTGLWGLIK